MADIRVLEQKLKLAADNLKSGFQTIRSGRPSPRMVEDIRVVIYGQQMLVKALGSISIAPPREIVISLWDKSGANTVAKAIEEDLMVTANIVGSLIRISLPALTDERKKELEKLVRRMTEETRIEIRGWRDETNKDIKKGEEEDKYSQDVAFKKKEEVQKVVDKINKEIEQLLENKLKEIFE